MKITKLLVLQVFLRFSAFLQAFYWSLSHLFFPRWYLSSIGVEFDFQTYRTVAIFINEIGILSLGIAIVTWIAARDPVKNFGIIIMLYVVSVGSIGISLYHMLWKDFSGNEWSTVIVIGIQLIILSILYPWRKIFVKEE